MIKLESKYELPVEIEQLPVQISEINNKIDLKTSCTVGLGGDYATVYEAILAERRNIEIISDCDFVSGVSVGFAFDERIFNIYSTTQKFKINFNSLYAKTTTLYFSNLELVANAYIREGAFTLGLKYLHNCKIVSNIPLDPISYSSIELDSAIANDQINSGTYADILEVVVTDSYIIDLKLIKVTKLTLTISSIFDSFLTVEKGGQISHLYINGNSGTSINLIELKEYAKINSAQHNGTTHGFIKLNSYSEINNSTVYLVKLAGLSVVKHSIIAILIVDSPSVVVKEISNCQINKFTVGTSPSQEMYDILSFYSNHITSTSLLNVYSHNEIFSCKFNSSVKILANGVSFINCKIGSAVGGYKTIISDIQGLKTCILTSNVTEASIQIQEPTGNLITNNILWT